MVGQCHWDHGHGQGALSLQPSYKILCQYQTSYSKISLVSNRNVCDQSINGIIFVLI